MNDYIIKPIRANDLYAAIARNAPPTPTAPKTPDPGEPPKQSGIDSDCPLPYDRKLALQTVGGNEDLLATIVEVFFIEAAELMPLLSAAIKSDDAELLLRTVHTMKSSCASIGAEAARAAAAKLESLSKPETLTEAAPAAVDLKKRMDELLLALAIEWPPE